MTLHTLLDEFRGNYRAALQAEGMCALADVGLRADRGSLIGFARVKVANGFYEPAADGSAAVIVPAFTHEDGSPDVYDLVAVGLNSRRSATRRGIVQHLGDLWLDVSVAQGNSVRVFLDGLEWLSANCAGMFFADIAAASFVLGDSVGIWCSDDAAAALLCEAMKRPSRIPPIYVPAEVHHAA